jgi:desulfoferrodoxin-like iron-binding protein
MASQMGKRYKCEVCGTEILCIKAGSGQVICCGKEVKLQQPRAIPSSD